MSFWCDVDNALSVCVDCFRYAAVNLGSVNLGSIVFVELR